MLVSSADLNNAMSRQLCNCAWSVYLNFCQSFCRLNSQRPLLVLTPSIYDPSARQSQRVFTSASHLNNLAVQKVFNESWGFDHGCLSLLTKTQLWIWVIAYHENLAFLVQDGWMVRAATYLLDRDVPHALFRFVEEHFRVQFDMLLPADSKLTGLVWAPNVHYRVLFLIQRSSRNSFLYYEITLRRFFWILTGLDWVHYIFSWLCLSIKVFICFFRAFWQRKHLHFSFLSIIRAYSWHWFLLVNIFLIVVTLTENTSWKFASQRSFSCPEGVLHWLGTTHFIMFFSLMLGHKHFKTSRVAWEISSFATTSHIFLGFRIIIHLIGRSWHFFS
jgi:hypothetical protein